MIINFYAGFWNFLIHIPFMHYAYKPWFVSSGAILPEIIRDYDI